MIKIELKKIPNQSLVFENSTARFEIKLNCVGNAMVASIKKNDVEILSSVILVAGVPIIPYPHLAADGNFIIYTVNNEIPHWSKFEQTQELYYYD